MTTTSATVQQIRRDGVANRRQIIADFIANASTWRPVGFEASRKRRRAHYRGDAGWYIERQLERLFPKTWKSIHVYPLAFAHLAASTIASFYDEEPARVLVDIKGGEEIDADDPRSLAFADLIRQSRAAVKLPEADRRAVWMGDALIAVRARPTMIDGAVAQVVRLELHDADAAWVLPNPSAPTDLQQARGFCLRVRTVDAAGRAVAGYELWTRADGDRWIFSTEQLDGMQLVPEQEYAGTILPFVMVHAEDPEGLPFVERGDDDVTTIEMLNVDMADEAFIGHMQGHTEKVYQGTRHASEEMIGGPGAVLKIDTGEQLTALDYNPKLEAMRTAALQRQKTWALTKRINLDAFSIDAQVPESGVARAIKNEPQDKMRRERDVLLVEMEQAELWPVAIDVWGAFCEPSRAIAGVRVQVTPRRRQAYEDIEAKQRRLETDLRLGVVSLARYAVEMGHFTTLDAAVAAGLSDALGAVSAPAAEGAPSRFAQMLQAEDEAPKPGGSDAG